MSQKQLETAWLTAIFCRPKYCQRWMLHGLDRSMFENRNIFDIGHMWLRSSFDDENEFMPDMAEVNMKSLPSAGLSISELVNYFDSMCALPSYYPMYCDAIQSRNVPKIND